VLPALGRIGEPLGEPLALLRRDVQECLPRGQPLQLGTSWEWQSRVLGFGSFVVLLLFLLGQPEDETVDEELFGLIVGKRERLDCDQNSP